MITIGWQRSRGLSFFKASKENHVIRWKFKQKIFQAVSVFTSPSGKN